MDPATVMGHKRFGATFCIGEPPDVEYMIDTIWEGLRQMRRTDKPGTTWKVETPKAFEQTSRGLYFGCATDFEAANMTVVTRMVVKVWATPFDTTGNYCSGAYPLHVNLVFMDTWGWELPLSEQVVGISLRTAEWSISNTFGLPSSQMFWLLEGVWRYGPQYNSPQRA